MKNTYRYQRVQGGYWGRTTLDKIISIKAESQAEADLIVAWRKDAHKRLANGDWLSWYPVIDN